MAVVSLVLQVVEVVGLSCEREILIKVPSFIKQFLIGTDVQIARDIGNGNIAKHKLLV